jgi:hypothetical protein
MFSCIYVCICVLVVTTCVPGCYFEDREESQAYTLGQTYVFAKVRQNHSCDRGSCSFQEVVLRPYVNPALLDTPSEASFAWLKGASAEEVAEMIRSEALWCVPAAPLHPGDSIYYADSEDFYDAPAGDSDTSV